MLDVVEQAMRGDREAFAWLVNQTSDRMYAVARRILRDTHLADDAPQSGVLSMTAPGYGCVILEAGVIKVAPGDNVEHQAGPSDLSDYFGGDASAVAKLCAALGEG